MDIIFTILVDLTSLCRVETMYIDGAMNFNKCSITTKGYLVLYVFLVSYKIIVFLVTGFLVFIEYNLIDIKNDTKIFTILIYLNILLSLLLVFINIINLKQFYLRITIRIAIITLFSIVNYITIIWYRMYIEKFKFNDFEIKPVRYESTKDNNKSTNSVSSKENIVAKLINYHYIKNSSTSIHTNKLKSSHVEMNQNEKCIVETSKNDPNIVHDNTNTDANTINTSATNTNIPTNTDINSNL